MKRILPILCGILILAAAPFAVCSEPTRATAVSATEPAPQLSDEAWTEQCFYRFIRYDVIGQEKPVPQGELCYDGFPNAQRAYGAILGFIAPASAKLDFDRHGSYESDMLRVVYTERGIKGGFARLTVEFKKREAPGRYTVVFRRK